MRVAREAVARNEGNQAAAAVLEQHVELRNQWRRGLHECLHLGAAVLLFELAAPRAFDFPYVFDPFVPGEWWVLGPTAAMALERFIRSRIIQPWWRSGYGAMRVGLGRLAASHGAGRAAPEVLGGVLAGLFEELEYRWLRPAVTALGLVALSQVGPGRWAVAAASRAVRTPLNAATLFRFDYFLGDAAGGARPYSDAFVLATVLANLEFVLAHNLTHRPRAHDLLLYAIYYQHVMLTHGLQAAIACHALWDVVVMGLPYALAWALPARWRGKATLADGTESAARHCPQLSR